jgi:predicted nucleotidyltransferase component of viral defense system
MDERRFPYPHDEDFDIFQEALSYSEATTGFTATLIEKDYYSSLILRYFFDSNTPLAFKGGTCFSKVYTDFYRLSEDLDFIIPIPSDAPRRKRRAEIEPVKHIFENLPTVVPGMAISEAFKGHNESRQYIGYLTYRSAIIEKQEMIKIEVGVREPLLLPAESRMARTIVTNPFSGRPLLPPFTVRAMTMREGYAEKCRAALSREEPAIRDFYDLFSAIRETKLDPQAPDLLGMVREKLMVPGNPSVDISSGRKWELERQLEGQLKPVLRPSDFIKFNLDEAFEVICAMAKAVSV